MDYVAYTDGACSASIGGWAFTLNDESESGWMLGTTNNQMELYAILMMVEAAESDSFIVCHTDSKLAIGWLVHSWARNKPPINHLVWAIWLVCHAKNINVHYRKVKGHASCQGNNRVDVLAQAQSRYRRNQGV